MVSLHPQQQIVAAQKSILYETVHLKIMRDYYDFEVIYQPSNLFILNKDSIID